MVAQVKSVLIFAALAGPGESIIIEKEITRNHTEDKANWGQGAKFAFRRSGNSPFRSDGSSGYSVRPSAGSWIDCADSKIILENVAINEPYRYSRSDRGYGGRMLSDGILAKSATIIVETSGWHGDYARLVHAWWVADCCASKWPRLRDGLSDAEELKVAKPTVSSMSSILNSMGANAVWRKEARHDAVTLHAQVNFGDHRTMMHRRLLLCWLKASGWNLNDLEAIKTSYPSFSETWSSLMHG